MPPKKETETLWDIMDTKESEKTEEVVSEPSKQELLVSDDEHLHLLFCGNSGSGKSTLIDTFLNKSTENTKATVALDYTFARKTSKTGSSKQVYNLWELGGLCQDPSLFEVPFLASPGPVPASSVCFVVVLDLNQPDKLLFSTHYFLAMLFFVQKALLASGKVREEEEEKEDPSSRRERRFALPLTTMVICNNHDAESSFFSLSSSHQDLLLTKLKAYCSFFQTEVLLLNPRDEREHFRLVLNKVLQKAPLDKVVAKLGKESSYAVGFTFTEEEEEEEERELKAALASSFSSSSSSSSSSYQNALAPLFDADMHPQPLLLPPSSLIRQLKEESRELAEAKGERKEGEEKPLSLYSSSFHATVARIVQSPSSEAPQVPSFEDIVLSSIPAKKKSKKKGKKSRKSKGDEEKEDVDEQEERRIQALEFAEPELDSALKDKLDALERLIDEKERMRSLQESSSKRGK